MSGSESGGDESESGESTDFPQEFAKMAKVVQRIQHLQSLMSDAEKEAVLIEVSKLDEELDAIQQGLEVVPTAAEKLDASSAVRMFQEPAGSWPTAAVVDELVAWLKEVPEEIAWFDTAASKTGVSATHSFFLRNEFNNKLRGMVNKMRRNQHLSSAARAFLVPVLSLLFKTGWKIASATQTEWRTLAADLKEVSKSEQVLKRDSRKKPSGASAGFAIFHTKAFAAARADDDPLTPGLGRGSKGTTRDLAVRECRVALRNEGFLKPKVTSTPFQLPPKRWLNMDLDGDILVACGDLHFDARSSERNFMGFYKLLDSIDFRVGNDGVCGTGADMGSGARNGPQDLIYPLQQKRGWVSSVLADAAANLVWGADRNRGLITAFSTSDNSLQCALSLPRDYFEATQDNCNYVMARVGDMLCCAGGDGKLRLWNVPRALDEYPTWSEKRKQLFAEKLEKMKQALKDAKEDRRRNKAAKRAQAENNSDHDDEDEEEEEEEEDEEESEDDASESDWDTLLDDRYQEERSMPSAGMLPSFEQHVLPKAAISNVQPLTDSKVLISFGAMSEDLEDMSRRTSLRIWDVEAGRLVGILAGHTTPPSMERQLCASMHLAFTSEDRGVCKVWDLRTCKTAFTLPRVALPLLTTRFSFTDPSVSFLGVPQDAGGAFAFTSADDECIRAWDLRLLRAEALWKMSTGNLFGTQLAWHEKTKSLFATTINRHDPEEGFSEWDYLEFRREHREEDPWPTHAFHSQSYFAEPFTCDSPVLLRYAFGGPSPASFKKWAKEETSAAEERTWKRMNEFAEQLRSGAGPMKLPRISRGLT